MRVIHVIFLILLGCHVSRGAGGVETFLGRGAFESQDGRLAGLDLAGWIYSGDGFIDSNGLRITNGDLGSPKESELDRVSRVDNVASFSSRVVVENVDLGEAVFPFDYVSTIGLSHSYTGTEDGQLSGLRTLVIEDGRSGESEWFFTLSAGRKGQGFDFLSAVVPSGSDIVLELNVLANERLAFAELYNSVVADEPTAVLGPIALPPFADTVEYLTAITMTANGAARSNGTITRFSSLPLDASDGDFDGDGTLGFSDINMLSRAARSRWKEPQFDLNQDGVLNGLDVERWVHEKKMTYFGDADLNGEFASSDLVNVFAAGEYEDDMKLNSAWSTGDWDGDGDFTTSDFVLAFEEGGYEQGARVTQTVPEPLDLGGAILGLLWLASSDRKTRQTAS